MSGIALVISDVDGTLVTTDKRLTERSRAAVAALRQRGVRFTVVSSRPPFGLRMLVEPLALDQPMAAFNGCAIVTPALAPVEAHAIGAAAARTALAFLGEHGVDAWLFTTRDWMVRDPKGAHVDHERHTVLTEPRIVADFTAYLDQAAKIVGVSDDFARLAALEETARERLAGQASVVRSQNYYLDITAPGIDKGVAVTALCRSIGVPPERTAVLGDMGNDVSMFRVAGFSVAMGNASDAVKRAASATTRSNEDDGFADAVEALILPRAG
jgi:Cof subfamily protein (haloacid dehalogenase superfamily)